MGLRLGDEAPDFMAHTTEGEIDFHEWKPYLRVTPLPDRVARL